MIIFKFSTEDLTEDQKEFYQDVELRFDGVGHDLDTMLDFFKRFLFAMTFSSYNINEIVCCDEECQVKEGQEI